MLSDTARKLLRIIYNQYRDAWHVPSLDEMTLRSQRKENDVKRAMRELVEAGNVEAKDGKIRVVNTKVK